MDKTLEDVRAMLMCKVEENSYPYIIGKMVVSCLPSTERNILISDLPEDLAISNMSDATKALIADSEAKGFERMPFATVIKDIGPMLANTVPVSELKEAIDRVKFDVRDEYESQISLCDFESMIIASENILNDITVSAESTEDANNAVTKLQSVLNDTEIPDVILTIRKDVKKEFAKSKTELEKIKAKDNEVIPDSNESGLDFDDGLNPYVDPDSDDGDTVEGTPDEGSTPAVEPVEPGDDGELFNESFVIKYGELLHANISYVVSNVVSKMVFKYMCAHNVKELPPIIKTRVRLISYLSTAFAIMLNHYGLMSYDTFGRKMEKAYLEV